MAGRSMSAQMQLGRRRRWSDAGRGLAALLGVIAVVVGIPVGLISWVGWPLPSEVPTVSEVADALRDTYIPDEFLVKALAVVCWLVWIELVASLLVEAVAYGRGRRAGHVPLAGGMQRGAARLVATVALLGSLLATKGLPGSDGHGTRPLAPPVAGPTAALIVDDPTEGPATPAAATSTPSPAPRAVYEVQRRDTLWDIAERHLGDPFRWQEIFRLNEGKAQPNGHRLTDPDLIYPGWWLELPEDARGLPSTSTPAEPPAEPADPSGAAPGGGDTGDGDGSGDGDGMVLLDDGRDDGAGVIADAIVRRSAAVRDHVRDRADAGGMVLLPDDDDGRVWGSDPPAEPPAPDPRDDHIAARDQ
ncbi:MAG TPA: LysM peptidoglycan-binding domain-containing protein [Acidimicrobiales bacterium]|nr:LysM peptidoglycan-binding domain-containing protein [Acidimicrobiales bacterium]